MSMTMSQLLQFNGRRTVGGEDWRFMAGSGRCTTVHMCDDEEARWLAFLAYTRMTEFLLGHKDDGTIGTTLPTIAYQISLDPHLDIFWGPLRLRSDSTHENLQPRA